MSGKHALHPDNFPLMVSGKKIVAQDGRTIATTEAEADAIEIARRLNESEDRKEEDRWQA
jgi:hypothetical protein